MLLLTRFGLEVIVATWELRGEGDALLESVEGTLGDALEAAEGRISGGVAWIDIVMDGSTVVRVDADALRADDLADDLADAPRIDEAGKQRAREALERILAGDPCVVMLFGWAPNENVRGVRFSTASDALDTMLAGEFLAGVARKGMESEGADNALAVEAVMAELAEILDDWEAKGGSGGNVGVLGDMASRGWRGTDEGDA